MLERPIHLEKDKLKVFEFLDNIKQEFPDEELFVFGGEPFLHPFFGDIMTYMNHIGLKFVVQTNFSKIYTIRNMSKRTDFNLQISLHPSEIKGKMELLNGISALQGNIRQIDIMYVGQPSLDLFKEVLPILTDKSKLYMAPVADFNLKDVCNKHLFEFNRLKKTVIGRVYNFEQGDRSYNWEKQMKGEVSYKGKPCIYENEYVLFDPSLERYTCNYRQNNKVCPNDQCFLM